MKTKRNLNKAETEAGKADTKQNHRNKDQAGSTRNWIHNNDLNVNNKKKKLKRLPHKVSDMVLSLSIEMQLKIYTECI